MTRESSAAQPEPRAPLQPLAVNEADAAAMIGLSASTLAKMRCKGAGPTFVSITGRRLVYMVSALEEWLLSRPSHRSTADGRPAAPVGSGRPQKRRAESAT